jgi:hypothetical protein
MTSSHKELNTAAQKLESEIVKDKRKYARKEVDKKITQSRRN